MIKRGNVRYTSASPMNCSSRLIILSGRLLALGGCFGITSEGKKMRSDVDNSAARVQKLEAAQNAQLEQLKQAEAKAQESIKQLEGVIEQATSVVQRNSADVTVHGQRAAEQGRRARGPPGRAAVHRRRAEEGARRRAATALPARSAAATERPQGCDDTPADKNEHYAAAYRAYSERDFAKARALFRSFIERYNTDAQADNAQYWMGASYLIENRPATALAELRKVIQNFRGGDAVDEALLDMAEAFYRLRACSDSRNALGDPDQHAAHLAARAQGQAEAQGPQEAREGLLYQLNAQAAGALAQPRRSPYLRWPACAGPRPAPRAPQALRGSSRGSMPSRSTSTKCSPCMMSIRLGSVCVRLGAHRCGS